ncbi:MAG: hypothetical protein HC896_08210 [Bacteroidales bacterium]|nr:hypothetical protein [Bacteroidales bacterium]
MGTKFFTNKRLNMKSINKISKGFSLMLIMGMLLFVLAIVPAAADPSNTTSDIKIFWKDFETLRFEIQVEDGQDHVLIMKFRAGSDDLFIIAEDDDDYLTPLTYQNIDDMRQNWDGYVNMALGTFTWGTINNSNDDQWVTIEWKPNYSSSQAIQISSYAEISGDGTSNDWNWTNWPGGDGGKKYFIKSIPAPEGFTTTFTADQKGKCDWTTPSDITNIISKNSELTKSEIWIDRGGSNASEN